MASTTLISFRCFERQHVDKTHKSSKTNLIYKGSSCNLCNQPMVWLCPAGIKQKSPIQKKTVMSFHNYEKKVNRKTNKIRQVIDDPKKNIKCSGKKRSKKNRFEKRREKKNKNLRFRWKNMIWDNFFSFCLGRNFPQ